MAHFILRAPVGLALAMLVATSVTAAESPAELVQDALHQEIYGRKAVDLLARAAQVDPDYAPAYWHRGYVKNGDAWVKAAAFQPSDALKNYFIRRDQTGDSLGQHLATANWCQTQGLESQERVHLMRVLAFNPDHVDARARLGFEPTAAGWVSTDDRLEAQRQLQLDRQNLDAWRGRAQEIVVGLRHRSGKRNYMAKTQLQGISDPNAIVAIEAIVSNSGEAAGQLAVDAISKLEGQEAVDSLIRHSLYSPWVSVRDAAARRLKTRDPLTFAPQLLGTMKSPVSRQTFIQRDGKNVQYCRVLMRENQDERQLVAVNLDGRELMNDILSGRLSEQEKALGEENYRTNVLNHRAARTLAIATDQDLPADPTVWWTWWNEANELYVEGEKPTRDLSPALQLVRLERAQQWERNRQAELDRQWADRQAQQQRSMGGRRRDCLAAGTLVWTIRGPRAIDKIKMGDMVLSQDPETGELAYQAVLQTTIRPKTPLVAITAGADTIVASGGHPFWVAGEGWVKARNVVSGMELHGAEGPVAVSQVEPSPEAVTYNLIVDGFNSYFVVTGKQSLLSHDNTMRDSVETIVPGLRN